MIRTYYIKGYVVEEPYLDSKMKARCYSDKTLYESLSRIVKLILVSKNGTIIFKSVAKIKQGKLFHKYSKKTNWFKFSRAIFGLRDLVRATVIDATVEDFVGNCISYNTVTRKWVKTNKKDIFKPSSYINEHIVYNYCIYSYSKFYLEK